MDASTIKLILDRNGVAESQNLSVALSEIFSSLSNDNKFASDLSKNQSEVERRNNRMSGIL